MVERPKARTREAVADKTQASEPSPRIATEHLYRYDPHTHAWRLAVVTGAPLPADVGALRTGAQVEQEIHKASKRAAAREAARLRR